MHTENSICMKAPVSRIFAVASDLSRWPSILPHYRYVRYLSRDRHRNIVRMSAKRGIIPVAWTAEQEIDPERQEIRFRHLRAFTRGMTVVWTLTPDADGTLVRIRHDLEPQFPFFNHFIGNRIIGEFFVSAIAGQTLLSMKSYVESADAEPA